MKSVLRPIGVALLFVFDRISEFLLAWRQKAAGVTQGIERYEYGFVFTSDIGDAVLFSMFLRVFSKGVCGRYLVITSKTNAQLLQPFFAEADFLTIDYAQYKAALAYRFRKMKEVMGVALEHCVVPIRSRDYCLTDSIAKVAGRNQLIAFASDESNRCELEAYLEQFIYDERVGGFSAEKHELMTYGLLLERFGIDFRKALQKEIPRFREQAREEVAPLPAAITGSYVVMNAGASQLYKRWPIEKFVALAERIYAESSLISVFVGGPSEKDLQGAFGAHPFIVDLVMQTGSFDVLREIIFNARAVVSNDTFICHYATVLGVPTVCIAGGGHGGRFFPYPDDALFSKSYTVSKKWPCFNCGWDCTRLSEITSNSFPCIGDIGIGEVFAAIRETIEPSSLPDFNLARAKTSA